MRPSESETRSPCGRSEFAGPFTSRSSLPSLRVAIPTVVRNARQPTGRASRVEHRPQLLPASVQERNDETRGHRTIIYISHNYKYILLNRTKNSSINNLSVSR